MLGIDQKKQSKIKTASIIKRDYGGRISFVESVKSSGNGVGNLQYVSGLEHEGIIITTKFYKCNLERLQGGLALYVFNDDINALFLLRHEEIKSVELKKLPDIIDPAKKSYFRWMMNKGYNYYKCKYMLLEHEIVEDQKAILTLELEDGIILKFSNRSYSPKKISRFFNSILWQAKYSENLQHSINLNQL